MGTKTGDDNTHALATFAGGCFWCMEPVFKIHGVESTVVGYSGGTTPNPTYEKIDDHKEAIQLKFDSDHTPYPTLVKIFLHNIDPTDPNGQFYDRGPQYQTAIFYHDESQKRQAEQALAELVALVNFKKPPAVQILPYKNFYPAEDYHQGYYKKNPEEYERYKVGSGRNDYLAKTWNGKILNSKH